MRAGAARRHRASTRLAYSHTEVSMKLELTPPLFGFIVGTRAALGVGIGLLLSSRIPVEKRRRIGLTLVALGAATTVPAVRGLMRSRSAEPNVIEPGDRDTSGPWS
jgi:hypothetical protein